MKRVREEDGVLTKGEYLGEGASGRVWLYIDESTGEEFACKIISKAKKEKHAVDRLNEVRILQLLGGYHPNIVKLHSTEEDSNSMYLFFENCGTQSLHSYARGGQAMKEEEAAKIFKGLMTGIAFCHSKCVLHGDVKPDNLMLKPTGDDSVRVKIIDFGWSTVCCESEEALLHKPNMGTERFRAPEVIDAKKGYGLKADVWSAGLVLYWMLTGDFPAAGSGDFGEKAEESRGGPWMQLSAAAKDLVCKMLCKDVKVRLSAADVLKHKWITRHTSSRLRMLAKAGPRKRPRLRHLE